MCYDRRLSCSPSLLDSIFSHVEDQHEFKGVVVGLQVVLPYKKDGGTRRTCQGLQKWFWYNLGHSA